GVDGIGQIAASKPLELTPAGPKLFFLAQDAQHGYELWKSDGTAAGTVLVKDINPGPMASVRTPANYSRAYLTNINGVVYFAATDGVHGTELWKSNGTEAGTVMVKEIMPTASESNPQDLVNFNGTLYLTATDGEFGAEL